MGYNSPLCNIYYIFNITLFIKKSSNSCNKVLQTLDMTWLHVFKNCYKWSYKLQTEYSENSDSVNCVPNTNNSEYSDYQTILNILNIANINFL